MPFTKSWTDIPDSSIDPDSPVDTTLMTELRDNPIFLAEWIGTRATAAVSHAHKGAATDGTDKVNYSDLAGSPPIVSSQGIINSQDIFVTAGGSDGTFDTGAIGFDPVLCISMIAAYFTGSPNTLYMSHGIATASGSYFIGQKTGAFTSSDVLSNTNYVGQAPSSSGSLYVSVTQFTSAGIIFNCPADIVAGKNLNYKIQVAVTG